MRAFSFTTPADTTYRSLWTTLSALSNWSPPNAFVPDRGCQLILNAGTAGLSIGDSNAPTVPGMPIAANVPIIFQSSPSNKISLKEIYLSGNAIAVSGWFVY